MQDTPHVYFDLILKCSSLLLCWGFWEEWVRGLDIGRWAVEWGWECFISASSVITYTSKTKLSFLLFSTHTHTHTHPYIYIYIYIRVRMQRKISRVLTRHSSPLTPSLIFPGPRVPYKNLISLYTLMVSFVTLIISLEWGVCRIDVVGRGDNVGREAEHCGCGYFSFAGRCRGIEFVSSTRFCWH